MEIINYKTRLSKNLFLKFRDNLVNRFKSIDYLSCPTWILIQFHIFISINNSLWNRPRIVIEG